MSVNLPTWIAAASRRDPFIGGVWDGPAAMLVVLPSSIAYGVPVFTRIGRDHLSAACSALSPSG